MRDGTEIWKAAQQGTKSGDARSANVMRVYALSQMLAQAETAVVTGDDTGAVERLRELQAHVEKLVAELAPGEKKGPQLVAA